VGYIFVRRLVAQNFGAFLGYRSEKLGTSYPIRAGFSQPAITVVKQSGPVNGIDAQVQ